MQGSPGTMSKSVWDAGVLWSSEIRQEKRWQGDWKGGGGPSLPQILVLGLEVLHLGKSFSPRQMGTMAQATKEQKENHRHCLSMGVLSHST